MVLKLSIRTLALPRQEQPDLAPGVLTMWSAATVVQLGCDVDLGCRFFTLNTHQTTFINDILSYACGNWSLDTSTQTNRRTEGQTDVEVEIVI